MYRLERSGAGVRLQSSTALTAEDFTRLSADLGVAPAAAKKSGFVSARVATESERLAVHWNGMETEIDVAVGDFVVTNMDPNREILRDANGAVNTYAVKPAKFADLYERATGATDFGEIYRPRGVVQALYLPGGFEIMAPWGELQRAPAGYVVKNGDDIYGNNKETFELTYRFTDATSGG